MRSERVGVQALIREDAPKVVYMKCSGHYLNLVIAGSCALPVVRNALDKVRQPFPSLSTAPNEKIFLVRSLERKLTQQTKKERY